MSILKDSDLITETAFTPTPLQFSRFVDDLLPDLCASHKEVLSKGLEIILYLARVAESVTSSSTALCFKVPEYFDFTVLSGVPFFYDRRVDANHNYFIHIHVNRLLALLFYGKFQSVVRNFR